MHRTAPCSRSARASATGRDRTMHEIIWRSLIGSPPGSASAIRESNDECPCLYVLTGMMVGSDLAFTQYSAGPRRVECEYVIKRTPGRTGAESLSSVALHSARPDCALVRCAPAATRGEPIQNGRATLPVATLNTPPTMMSASRAKVTMVSVTPRKTTAAKEWGTR